jgi:hypothetical protein
VYYILGYNQLSNSCTKAADEPAHRVNTCMYRRRFAITFEKLPKSTDGATRAKYPVDTPVLTHLRLHGRRIFQ